MTVTTAYNYKVDGRLFDSKGQPIKNGTVQLVYIPEKKFIPDPYKLEDEFYSAWVEENPDLWGVYFTAPGYKGKVVSMSQLMAQPNVTLENSIPVFAIALVLGAVMIMRKRGKIGAFGTSDVMTIFYLLGGVIAFTLIKKILEKFGIWDSQDTKDLDHASEDPNSFWNPVFWQTAKPANAQWTYAITYSTAVDYAKQIYDAFGVFNDDEEAVIGVFKLCRTKANASYIAYAFQHEYGEDLLKFLRGSWIWPQDRLSDADVNEINQYINRLPKY
jgi:hypothetical protein